ncbi:MAG: biopolymer transporter ExbD [Gammaproteobacteria bacterium]|nr:biopolymer transporter ExbD [Gammaproteobacteria bacterium]
MKNSRRIKRMSRNRSAVTKMNLTSLMDVFTILVFFLLVNSGQSEVLDAPNEVVLPESIVESRPRETVVIFVSPDDVVVQGEAVVRTADIAAMTSSNIEPITTRLAAIKDSIIGPSTLAAADSQEVTILADKSIPFDIIKKIMSACTGEGFTRISLAVTQKAPEAAEA